MQPQGTEPTSHSTRPLAIRDGVLLLSGYGVRVGVHHGRLAVGDGLNGERRAGEFARATSGLRRLVVLGHSGFVTLDALRWLTDVGASYVQIDADGRLTACSTPSGFEDPRLTRAQALATTNGIGLRIVHELLREKLDGQRRVLERVAGTEGAQRAIAAARDALANARTIEEMRFVESAAAISYWEALAQIPVQFAQKDRRRVPEHWRTLGGRSSPIGGAPRNAVNPANAILNYLYSVLETEARIAARTLGLDPSMGLLHSDRRFRASLVHDLVEPVRPLVDAYVLELLEKHVFSARDFVETRTGTCRLVPPLPQFLAQTGRIWARHLAPVADRAVRALAKTPGSGVKVVPALTTRRTRAAERKGESTPKEAPLPPARCERCGAEVGDYRDRHCFQCFKLLRVDAAPRLRGAGPAALARMRAEGRDPTHGGETRRKRAAKAALRHREHAGWRRTREQIARDREQFVEVILPKLRDVPLPALVNATGLSKAHCSMIKRGLRVPHPKHWVLLTGNGLT